MAIEPPLQYKLSRNGKRPVVGGPSHSCDGVGFYQISPRNTARVSPQSHSSTIGERQPILWECSLEKVVGTVTSHSWIRACPAHHGSDQALEPRHFRRFRSRLRDHPLRNQGLKPRRRGRNRQRALQAQQLLQSLRLSPRDSHLDSLGEF